MGMLAFNASAQEQSLEKCIGVIPGGYNYWFATPADTTEAKPLIVFLHGASLKGNDLNRVKKYGTIHAVEMGREIDAYVIGPQLPAGSWKPEKVKEIVDYVIDNYNVDTSRIYVLGMSLGGYGTLDYAAAYPDQVAAAIAMCGGSTAKDVSGLNNVPLWIIHGTADRSVPISQSEKVVSKMEEDDETVPRLIFERVPGMDHSRPARLFYLPDIYDWLFQHSLEEEGRPIHDTFVIDADIFSRCYEGIKFKRNK